MADDGSVIGQATVVRGNLRGDGSVEIYGRVEGDVSVTGDVTVGEGAVVRGSVVGARLTVGGTVTGDLTGSEAVALGASAEVSGEIVAPRIGIEEGAQVNGSVRTAGGGGASNVALARTSEPRRAPARAPMEAVRTEAPAPKRAAAPAPAPVATAPGPQTKRPPPAPVVPAIRRGLAKKKSRRQ